MFLSIELVIKLMALEKSTDADRRTSYISTGKLSLPETEKPASLAKQIQPVKKNWSSFRHLLARVIQMIVPV